MLFLDKTLGRSLPVHDVIFPDESGNGFALRMLRVNGLHFCDLASIAASPGHRYLPSSAASLIAYLFGVKTADVLRAIPFTYKRSGTLVTRFMDHEIGRPYHTRLTRPQVCTECLREIGRALALWEISLASACPRHGCALIDVCPGCDRRLSWRRPGIAQCYCGFDLTNYKAQSATDASIRISRLIDGQLRKTTIQSETSAPDPLSCLSLDALLRVVRAIGLSEFNGGRDLVPGKVTRILTADEAQTIATLAINRIGRMDSPQENKLQPNSEAFWDLDRALSDASHKDAAIIRQILSSAAIHEESLKRRKDGDAQLSLDFDVNE